jgi:hypothetical protein
MTKVERRMTPTEKNLREHGVEMDQDEFEEVLSDIKDQSFRTVTVECILIHCGTLSKQFVDAARVRLSKARLPDWIILGGILNMRKHGRML